MIKTYWIDDDTTFIHGTLFYAVKSRFDKYTLDDVRYGPDDVLNYKDEGAKVWEWVRETFQDEFGGYSTWKAYKNYFYFQNEHDKTLFLIRWG